jgi:hypothetical protein
MILPLLTYIRFTATVLTCTPYQPVPEQCQGNPLITADGSHIDTVALRSGELRWCALSRDLLKRWGGRFDYGDSLYIAHPRLGGWWVVRDCMAGRFTNSVDLLTWEKVGKVKVVIIEE